MAGSVESPEIEVRLSDLATRAMPQSELSSFARLQSAVSRQATTSVECVSCHRPFPTHELVATWQVGETVVTRVATWRKACDSCVAAYLERQTEAERAQDQATVLDRWREAGLEPAQYRQTLVAFEPARLAPRADGTTAMDDARWFLDSLHGDPAPWLVLWGERGVGKTHLATGLTLDVCRAGGRAIFRTGKEMLDDLRATHAPGAQTTEAELQRRWARLSLLTLDEVGTERQTPYTAESYWAVLDGRYRTAMPLIITTNLPPDALAAHIGEAAASRLSERALVSEVIATDYRVGLRLALPTPIGPAVLAGEPSDVPF